MPSSTINAVDRPLVTKDLFRILFIQDLECYETAKCPRCRVLTHPECLTYVTKTGQVVGCSLCLPAQAKPAPAQGRPRLYVLPPIS